MSYTAHVLAWRTHNEALITRGRFALYFFTYQ